MKHFLLSMTVSREWTMHAYVMAKTKQQTTDIGMLMLEKAEEANFEIRVPIILVSELDDPGLPREIARENPESAKLMDKAKTMHYTAWLMSKDDPRHEKLMELH